MAKKNRAAHSKRRDEDDERATVPYRPEPPDLGWTLGGGAFASLCIFVVARDHPFVARALLSLIVLGIFLLRYGMGKLCPDPYAPVTRGEAAQATEFGFPGDDDDERQEGDR